MRGDKMLPFPSKGHWRTERYVPMKLPGVEGGLRPLSQAEDGLMVGAGVVGGWLP